MYLAGLLQKGVRALGKNPFQFDIGDWKKDPAVSALSCGTRGIYFDMLCAIHELDRGGLITGTIEELRSVCRCTALEMGLAITEMSRKNTVAVTERRGIYTIVNRRMRREYEERKSNAKRQQDFRHNDSSKTTTSSGAPATGPPDSNGNVTKVGHVIHEQEEDSLKEEKKETTASKVRTVFSYWQEILNHPQSKLTTDREAKIRRRLQEKYTVDELKLAINGCRASPWHMGENERNTKFDDIELICRDGVHVEKFIGLLDRANPRFNSRERKVISETQRVIDEINGEQDE